MRLYPCAIGALLVAASVAAGQSANLPPATQAAINARRDEVARQAKAETDAAIAKRNAGAMPDRLRTAAGNVTENRTGAGVGTLNIPLTIFLEDMPPNATIRGQKILNAVDNLGQPLLPSTNPAGAGGSVVVGAGRGRAAAGPTTGRSLQFQAPSRKAESIKLIEGEIEFIVQNEASMARVPSLATFMGKPVANPLLAKNEIEITYLTRELYDSLKPTWGTSAAASGVPNFSTSAVFLVKDPKNRMVSLEIQDTAGVVVQRTTQMRNTNALGEMLVEAQIGSPVPPVGQALRGALVPAYQAMPPDAQLYVLVAAPEALKTYSFRLENIPLP